MEAFFDLPPATLAGDFDDLFWDFLLSASFFSFTFLSLAEAPPFASQILYWLLSFLVFVGLLACLISAEGPFSADSLSKEREFRLIGGQKKHRVASAVTLVGKLGPGEGCCPGPGRG